ncbi:unnamed protein product [Rhizophagus irregularis]|nr:unnamed protein product [Rhizophagus irregularis]
MTSFNDWIATKIKNGDIDYIEYREFNNVKKVGRGGFGLVESADWKSCGIKIALKSLLDNSPVDENSMNEFVKELKNLKKVSFHPNIISFFGISKEPSSNKYAMVLDFANQGNLREYLAIHFNNLQWSDKIQMALDIVCGLKCLHFKHMIHRDLHAKNILVNNNRLMIADFGASKQLSEATSNSTNSTNSTADGIGMIEYMEPQRFVESPIEGTPWRYQQLYQECWDNDPNLRPDIEGVYDILTKLKNDDFPDIPSIVLQPQPDSQSSISEFFDSKQSKLMIPRSSSTTIEQSGKEEFRNLLIVGYASSGKSTLSNVLCDTDEFEESECSARNIRNFQKKIFKWNGTTYRLIDIGFSSIKKILCNKTEILQLIPEGISQVLFVVDGRFKEKEIETFEFFEKTIFESGIIEYTTIVRTKFCNFKNKNKCEEDKKQMCEESKTIAKIVESCSIIHVDNPPTNIIVNDDDDRERIVYNKKLRERSRTLLLSHLGFVCQNKYYGHNNVFKYSKLVIDLIPYLEKKEKEMKKISTPIPDELEEKKIRNLLVVGYSGSGKSTLTNVLNDTGRLEGNKQIRKTKNFQKRVFKRNETEYHIVDTIGIGDINLTKKQVICEKIAEVIYLFPEGISQVLFVIDGKFSAEKASTFNLLKDFIFESGIDKYITIVRTKFSNFKNEDECTKDKENLCDENESIAKLCKSIVYVDNPPVDISVRDDDDKETIRINKRRRNQSREILLDHLDKVCRKKYYKLKMWDKLHDRTSVRSIAQEVECNLNSEIPSLVYYFEEAESYSKPAQVDLPSPKIVEVFSSRETIETIGKLIIVGRTNSGKSTLAKVLEKKGTKYLVNDTGVTKLTKNIVKLYDGMCQFLFVIDGKFTAEEVKAIFDSGIYENITIVRTKFSNFKNEDECNKDKEELYKEIRSLHKESRIVAKICRSIVYVDNPPINISIVDEDDRKTNEINKKKRGRSRSILLEHLDKIFQEKYYELKAWLCNKTSIGNIGKVEQNLKLEIPTLNLSYFEEAERSFKEKISSNMTKNLGHNSNVCIKKYLKEWIEERIIEDIDYFNYNEFSKIENFVRRAHETLKKANWENKKIPVVLKNLSNPQISENDFKEFITKLKTFHKNYPNVNRFFGLTRDSNGNYFSVLEYVNGRNLRDYLKNKFGTLQWCDKLQMALGITQGLMWLHSKEIIHGNLHACNILVNNGMMVTITDLNLLKQAVTVTSENIIYIERQYLRNPHYERNIKSDVYSLGILLWELSSGRPPFFDYIQQVFGFARVENKLLNGEREEPVANTPLEYQQLYQNCWQDDPNSRPETYEILAQLEKQSDIYEQLNTQVIDGKSSSSTLDNDRLFDKEMFNRSSSLKVFNTKPQQIIRQFKLNHGLVLNGYDIMPSIQGVAVEDGELKLNLYKGQPLVYTCINSEENGLKIDTCINFPIAEIIYNGDLLESFIEKNVDDEKKSRELYGDFFARKVLTGGQLFIIDFNSATPTQIDTLKFYLYCVYNSAKYPTDFQFSSLFTLNTLPKLVTLDGEKLNTHEELTSWMNNLYQKKMVNIISYDELIPISRSERDTSLEDGGEIFKEIQPGVANFEERLSLEEWVGDVTNDNLISWTKDFNLFQGFIINKNDEMLISKKIPVDFIEIPKITPSNKSYLKIIKPSTKLEFTLVSNNIFSIKNLSTLPFVNNNNHNHDSYNHVLVKCEKYEILLNTKNIKPTKEFEQAIEEALDSMKPLKALQDVFNEYGHLFPRRIILGRSLKNILPNLSPYNTFDVVNDDDKILESIDSLNISSLLTQKGRIIEKNNLHNWICNTNNHLEIIEFDNIIPLYKILKTEHQKKIDDISKNNYRIIMTGITDLTDLKNNNIENYKRINIGLSLESEDYEVFGLIITENNTKSEEIYVNFGLYDFNGFYAIIKKSEGTSADITKCFVLWVIIGNPSKLSVFSPKNREIQVNYIKETVTLQLDNSNYHKKIPFQGYEGHLFSVHAYCPHKPNINVQIIKPICNDSISNTSIGSNSQKNHRDSRDSRDSLIDVVEVELRICVMSTNYKNLKIDHTKGKKEVEYPLDTSITTEVVNDFSPLVII